MKINKELKIMCLKIKQYFLKKTCKGNINIYFCTVKNNYE